MISGILILGCGRHIQPVSPDLRQFIRSMGMNLEAIDSRNAASTYNILNEEGMDCGCCASSLWGGGVGQSNGNKKSWKAGPHRSTNCSVMLGKVKDIKASSAEILSELLVTALDCLHPKEDNFLVQSTEGTNGKDSVEHNSSCAKPKKRRTKKEDELTARKSRCLPFCSLLTFTPQ
ncbi:unnamed protein product [Coffea canephora]|uniref:NADH dehydrogenase [ubiquinone] 1 alpha subcomplex assembly factor 3 n=1 Tax=Coffea canephora TaxID=49390 RepID=A0A068TNR8_COFCA|nr:unnamed protein product [Coffea canephora]